METAIPNPQQSPAQPVGKYDPEREGQKLEVK